MDYNNFKKVLVIDFSLELYRALFSALDMVLREPETLQKTIVKNILAIVNETGIDMENGDDVILAFDPPKKNTWRWHYYEKYKDGVPGLIEHLTGKGKETIYKGGRTKNAEIDWEMVFDTSAKLFEFFRDHTDFKAVKVNVAEADDVVFVAAIMHPEVIIGNYDKDFDQIWDHNPQMKLYDSKKKMWRGRSATTLEHIIRGDESDNIPPIKPRARVKAMAEKMMNEGIDTFLSVDLNLKGRFEFNKNLIDFNCIPDLVVDEIRKSIAKDQYNFNMFDTPSSLMKIGLGELSTHINKFKRN